MSDTASELNCEREMTKNLLRIKRIACSNEKFKNLTFLFQWNLESNFKFINEKCSCVVSFSCTFGGPVSLRNHQRKNEHRIWGSRIYSNEWLMKRGIDDDGRTVHVHTAKEATYSNCRYEIKGLTLVRRLFTSLQISLQRLVQFFRVSSFLPSSSFSPE